MTDANATEAQIDTDVHETTFTRDHDHALEVRVGGGNHEHVGPALNTRHTVAQNRLPPRGTGMVRDSTRDPIGVMVLDMVAEAQTTWRGVYSKHAS